MAATVLGSPMDWLEWRQDDHGPGDSLAELVDDLVKDRVAGAASTGRSDGVITLLWVEIEKVADQIQTSDQTVGDHVFNGTKLATPAGGGTAPSPEQRQAHHKKAHRRWAIHTGCLLQRSLNSRVHRPLNTLTRQLPCGQGAPGQVENHRTQNRGKRRAGESHAPFPRVTMPTH